MPEVVIAPGSREVVIRHDEDGDRTVVRLPVTEVLERLQGEKGDKGDPGDSGNALVLDEHINDITPHPVYDDGPSLVLLYQNAKV